MIRAPQVSGILLCGRLSFDVPGEASLVDLFHSLRFREFPSPRLDFTAYCSLYDGIGEGTIELVVTQVDPGTDVYRYQKRVTFPGRLQGFGLEMKLTKCRFPAPGRYAFVLRFEGEYLTDRYVHVYQS
jgi:uncharacterized protein DUF6941